MLDPSNIAVRGHGHVRLGAKLGEGAEGAVYAIDDRYVAKLYLPGRISNQCGRKLELMLSTSIADRRLAWPVAVLENGAGVIVGYLMPRAAGKPLQRSVFIRPLLESHFPHWTRLQLVDLATALLEPLQVLHRNGVLAGDVNGANILVGSDPSTPVFVDLDSCQIGEFRSAVGTIPFLAPRLIGMQLAATSRTFEDECFAIATLMFMVLVPGKPPYSHQGGGDPAQNIRAGRFPYATMTHDGDAAPRGPWTLIWAHLPRDLKTLFVRAFARHEVVKPQEWLTALSFYRYRLLAGRSTLDVFPKAPPAGLVAAFEHQRSKEPSTYPTCRECLVSFEVTALERSEKARRGMQVPRRCIPCRRSRRAQRTA